MNSPTHNPTRGKLLILFFVAALAGWLYWKLGDSLSLASLAERESQLRDYQQENPVFVYTLAFLVYVAVTGLSLPGAAPLTLVYGWYFGLVPGVILVSFASTAGATIAFLLSRYFFRESIQHRFGERLDAFNRNLEKDGAFYLFTLRLIPAVPFFVINAVMGLTPMKTWTYWWVSQVGMLAGTAVYVYAGASVPSLSVLAEKGASGIVSPQVIVAFVILGLFPLVVRKIMSAIRGPKAFPSEDSLATDASEPKPESDA